MKRPSRAELRLQAVLNKHFPMEWRYVGNRQLKIGNKYPDFVSRNGDKKLIELFGNYWHAVDEVDTRIKYFAEFGYSCIVIWEEELDDKTALIKHIIDGGLYTPKYPRLGVIHWGRIPQNSMAICDYCGEEYPKCRELQRFCSNKCRRRWWVKQRHNGHDPDYGMVSCVICSAEFQKTRPWARYCPNCRKEGKRVLDKAL